MDIGELTEDFDGFITPQGELIPIQDADRLFTALTGASENRDRITEVLWQVSRECCDRGYFEATFAYTARLLTLEDDPDVKARCYWIMGQMKENSGDFAAAVETYAAAFHLPQEPNEVWYFLNNNLGYCLNKIGRHAEAEKYCREAIGMQPRYHNAYKNLGIALEGLGRYADAASSYIYAARACPEDPRALAHLQNLLAAHGEVLDEVPDILAQLHECHEAAQSRRGKPRLQ